MKRIKLLIVLSLVFIVGFNFSMTEAHACSCVPPSSPTEELNNSSAVFSGKVIEIKDKNKNGIFQSSADPLEIRLQVIETWKGSTDQVITVETPRDSASCGFTFTVNEEYLVYAYGEEGNYQVNLCSRTAPLANASVDLMELGTGNSPTVGEELKNEKSNDSFNVQATILLLIALLTTLLLSIYILKRRKSK